MTPPWICARCRHVAVDHAVVRQPIAPWSTRVLEPCRVEGCDCHDLTTDDVARYYGLGTTEAENLMRTLEQRRRTPILTSDQVDLAQRRALGERAACEACGAPPEAGCARYCEANRA